ncbi:hypothetical protein [Natrinema salsiterrestre]|uniref:Uncharacterized protein n=1 Tax=Natrinema salsiterrestre TaxID=2950540 RepID=A0A9Q4PZI7_9EURY|nr:hypothetical protein [Natrinema salsiterrestre]MDF9744915.1 hypothetical protein [Natrinema salsiterrestre]
MEKERLPRWGWLLLGLFLASLVSSVLNLLLVPAVFAETYQSITVITTMAPVLIYVGVWYDEERQHYWQHSRTRIAGDVLFVVTGAALGSAIVLVGIAGLGLPNFVQDVIAMGGGFLLAWGLFWWRNPEVYSIETDG